MSSIVPRQAPPSGGPPWRRPRAPCAMQLPGQEIGRKIGVARLQRHGLQACEAVCVARPPFIIGGQVATVRRLKAGGEPYDASDECQSLGRFKLAIVR
jgi:hypothetical protein